MTKVTDIVRDALGHLRVIDGNSAIDANDAAEAIRTLNMMMRKWESEGLTLGWTDVASVNDTMPSPPEADEAISANLAMRLRSKYGTTLDSDTVHLANDGLALIRAQVASSQYDRLSYPDLPSGEGQPNFGGWRAGFYR